MKAPVEEFQVILKDEDTVKLSSMARFIKGSKNDIILIYQEPVNTRIIPLNVFVSLQNYLNDKVKVDITDHLEKLNYNGNEAYLIVGFIPPSDKPKSNFLKHGAPEEVEGERYKLYYNDNGAHPVKEFTRKELADFVGCDAEQIADSNYFVEE